MVGTDRTVNGQYQGVSVIIPAFNEENTVGETVTAFKEALPGCNVVVCDNASTDRTGEAAHNAGAVLIHEPLKGKGNAVRRLLASVKADIYVLSDADLTYDASRAAQMIELLISNQLEMVTGVRQPFERTAYRAGHIWGNALFNRLFGYLFKTHTQDVFSGYRVLSRRFARVLPVQSSGFEIETEMSAIASIMKLPTGELPVKYLPRREGSTSKLKTWSDGFRILMSYFRLLRHFYPKRFYTTAAAYIAGTSLLTGFPVIIEFYHSGLVPRLPTAVLASSLAVIAFVVFTTGIILESITRNRIEQRKLFFLLLD